MEQIGITGKNDGKDRREKKRKKVRKKGENGLNIETK